MRSVWLAASLAALIYVIHTIPLATWIVDDAGISYAYARSLATGHGLVSQPGSEPVEGFTNLAWVLRLSACVKLNAFDPTLLPKILGGSVVCAAMNPARWAAHPAPAMIT